MARSRNYPMCENPSARRARRNISKKLRTMESNRAAPTMFDTLSENCIFYISPMYEFSHRLHLKATKSLRSSEMTLSAITGREQMQRRAVLLDHLVGGDEQCGRHSQPKHPCGLVVYNQLDLVRLHDRQLCGSCAFEDAPDIDAGLSKGIPDIASVAHQPADLRKFTPRIGRGHPVVR